MKRSIYIILAVLTVFLSACDIDIPNIPGIENQNPAENGGTDGNELVIDRNEGVLRLPIYEYDTLNPLFTKSSSVREAMRLIYEPLFDVTGDYTAKPVLAEGYTVSDGGKKVTVRLKNGVVFHDGAKFTANDVKYTFELVKNYKGKYLEYVRDVRSCETSGENTVVFNLSKPVANFVSLLTFPIVKNKSSYAADQTFVPNGTGAYRYAGRGDVKELKLTANENWHDIIPGIKEVSLMTMTDKQMAIYAFGANEVDCITGRAVNLSKYNPKGKNNMYSYTSNDLTLIGMNFYNSVFWGKSTRQAFSYLIDKESIMKNIIYQRGTRTDVPINPDSWYYMAHNEVYEYDPAKAEELLALDGWVRGEDGGFSRTFNNAPQKLSFNILVNGENEEKLDIANEIAEKFISFGIPAGVRALSYDEYRSELSLKQFDMAVCEITLPNNMDPSMLLSSSGNYFTYSNPNMDKLLDDIGMITDKQALVSYYSDICSLFIDDAPFIPLFFREGTLICSTRIVGEILPGPENVFANIYEWYIQKTPNN
ncbi:MAG: peptide ABC transporter substrate-binding protein [Oscillospiraceae bacterium]|nr:peptide ABC transporter substrate-binding protein [Oscillospiraceae bacterium]